MGKRFLLALLLLLGMGAAEASFLRGSRGATITDSCILTSTCGATADAGETDDPDTDATAYSSATNYAEGRIVTDGGSYYFSLANSNLGNATSNTTWWRLLSTFYYISGTGSDSGSCTGSTTPATAKASPCTMLRAYDYIANGGSVTAPDGSMFLFNRGANHLGTFTFSNAAGQKYILGAYGTGARPVLKFVNNTPSYFTNAVLDFQRPGHIARNLTLDSQYTTDYPVSSVVGTFADGDVLTRTSDGTIVATVVGTQNNNYITVIHAVTSQSWSNGTAVQTSGGAKSAVVGSRTVVNNLVVTNDDIRIVNCELKNAAGNGITLGSNGTPGSADRFYFYNSTIHDVTKWGGNGGGIQGGWGTGQKILWSTFYDNGATTGSHNVYLEDLDNLEFGNNYSYMTSTSTKGNHCLVIHGAVTVADIHDNEFKRCRNGVGLNDGYSGASVEYMDQISFYRNLIWQMGVDSIPSDGLILDLKVLRNSVFSNNVAFGNTGVIILSDYNTAASNLPSANDLFVYNTFISDTNQGAGNYFFIVTGANTTAVTLANNALVSKRATLACVRRATTPAEEVNLLYNDIWVTTGRNGVINWNGTDYETQTGGAAADFSGATNGNATNQQTDPGFVTAVTTGSTESSLAGLLLNGSSFARNQGSPNGTVTIDVYQRTRNAVNPSMGFYEYLH